MSVKHNYTYVPFRRAHTRMLYVSYIYRLFRLIQVSFKTAWLYLKGKRKEKKGDFYPIMAQPLHGAPFVWYDSSLQQKIRMIQQRAFQTA